MIEGEAGGCQHQPVRLALRLGWILLSAWLVPAGAAAEAYPQKPVRIVTGGAGTFHDIVARQLADRLGKRWGSVVVVENQPAAGLTIGTGMVARSAPDGYTLVLSDRSALAVAPGLYKGLPYDVQADLAPISLVASASPVLLIHPAFPARDLREFIAYVKRHPGEVHYATAGPATATHVAGELLKQLGGLDIVLVHYRGGGAAMLALVAGEVPVATALIPAALPQIRAGRVKALAVASPKRFAGAPEIPTATEAGLSGFESRFWVGLLAPARTPRALIARLNDDVGEVVRSADMQAVLLAQGAEAESGSPEQFAEFIRSETLAMKRLIDRTGMRAD